MTRKAPAGNGSELAWFKSSYSGGNDGNSCVELATTPGTIYVRDSKNITGPSLQISPEAWADFVPYASEAQRRFPGGHFAARH